MKTKTGGNVQLGPYAHDKDTCKVSGRHSAPRTYVDSHRENTGVPKIKGHHFNGPKSKSTGKTFGK